MPQALEIEGALNVRDLGGCVMADGGAICSGRLLRSGDLHGLTGTGSHELFASRDV